MVEQLEKIGKILFREVDSPVSQKSVIAIAEANAKIFL